MTIEKILQPRREDPNYVTKALRQAALRIRATFRHNALFFNNDIKEIKSALEVPIGPHEKWEWKFGYATLTSFSGLISPSLMYKLVGVPRPVIYWFHDSHGWREYEVIHISPSGIDLHQTKPRLPNSESRQVVQMSTSLLFDLENTMCYPGKLIGNIATFMAARQAILLKRALDEGIPFDVPGGIRRLGAPYKVDPKDSSHHTQLEERRRRLFPQNP